MDSFSYDVSLADFEAFLENELITAHARALRIQGLWTALAVAGTVYVLLYSQVHNHPAAGSVAIIMALLLIYAYPGVMRHSFIKAARRKLQGAKDTAFGHFELEITADHFVATGPQSEGRVAWGAVQAFHVTPSHAFLYLGPSKAIIVPLSQLDSRSRERLLELLRAHVPKEASVA
jgi:hypothetical protein